MKIRVERFADMIEEREAYFSDCSPKPLYRFMLSIAWDRALPMMLMLMLNPSTATHLANDPTVERVCRRARALGLGGVIVLNAFAFRATDPDEMKAADDPVGELNDGIIQSAFLQARSQGWTVVVGWGVHGSHRGRDSEIQEMAHQCGVRLMCLGETKDGAPRHPLYIKYDQPLVPWPAAA